MKKDDAATRRIGTAMDEKLASQLEAIAEREDRSIASVIRRAVEREIAQHEEDA